MKAIEILRQYAKEGERLVVPSHPLLQYEGRIDAGREDGPLWTYPATYVRLRFRASRLVAVLTNYHAYWDNYMGVLLDGKERSMKINAQGVTLLPLCWEDDAAGGAPDGQVHELMLFKRQDSCHMVQLHGFIGDAGLTLLPCDPLPARRIEVYGDSVSAGEVSEAVDYCGLPDPEHNGEFSNSYYSYAWLTARKLNARLHDIAQGGIALQDGLGYFMEPEQQGMETIFDKVQYQPYLLGENPYLLGSEDGTGQTVGRKPLNWDFEKYVPQVVIVAVGQNDAHPVDFCAEDYDSAAAEEWRDHYEAFVRKLRGIHPGAHIICLTTILGHHVNWDRSIAQVCDRLNDPKVHHFLFSKNGCGTQGHIRKPEAEQMAEELAAYIDGLGENIWRDASRLKCAMERAQKGEPLTVGFLGGSITQGSLASVQERCYASLVADWWRKTFPKSQIADVNAGIGGTTSHFGVARVAEDLLSQKPDVVFVEFSVNDDDTQHFQETYEGLVRRILRCDWKPAVVLLYNRFYQDGHSAQRVHDEVGRHYALPRVCMGDEIYPRIASGELAMEEVTPDGLHPNDAGHALLADAIIRRLEEALSWLEADRQAGETLVGPEFLGKPCVLPEPLTKNRYEDAKRLRNQNLACDKSRGFRADYARQDQITDVFRYGWQAREKGAEVTFHVEAACIAVQYRKTIHKPAPVAVAILDGKEEEAIRLDANFDEDWGDCLYLQPILESDHKQSHRVTLRLTEACAVETEFYLVSLIVA